jgi:hypothetical protein
VPPVACVSSWLAGWLAGRPPVCVHAGRPAPTTPQRRRRRHPHIIQSAASSPLSRPSPISCRLAHPPARGWSAPAPIRRGQLLLCMSRVCARAVVRCVPSRSLSWSRQTKHPPETARPGLPKPWRRRRAYLLSVIAVGQFHALLLLLPLLELLFVVSCSLLPVVVRCLRRARMPLNRRRRPLPRRGGAPARTIKRAGWPGGGAQNDGHRRRMDTRAARLPPGPIQPAGERASAALALFI